MSAKISAVISGVSGWVPDEKLTNQQLSTMVDTSDEWITTRTGIKERRITNLPRFKRIPHRLYSFVDTDWGTSVSNAPTL